jgi:hypothetical protein
VDVLEGDILTVNSVDYQIVSVGEWLDYMQIIAEKVKGT